MIDSVTYSLSSSTSTDTLKIGDKITFVVRPIQSSTDAISLTGEFNSIPITFVTTSNGISFIGTYTVVEGHTDQSNASKLSQLQGLQLFDQAGNQGEFFDLSFLSTKAVWKQKYGEIRILILSSQELVLELSPWVPLYRLRVLK